MVSSTVVVVTAGGGAESAERDEAAGAAPGGNAGGRARIGAAGDEPIERIVPTSAAQRTLVPDPLIASETVQNPPPPEFCARGYAATRRPANVTEEGGWGGGAGE